MLYGGCTPVETSYHDSFSGKQIIESFFCFEAFLLPH